MEDRKKKVLVIIPAYNEAENIVHVVKHMMEAAPKYDYLVINDGSTDNTPDLCRRENIIIWISRSIWGSAVRCRRDISMRASMIMI